ncbi:SCY1 family protein kinase [Heterostelium album PN500]|uniref:SCY1 family protein kinase n=1 Tax=Heterostelium pallidum (strain ATCC 26659 / Pp 5 / PN500) TaxID=670386 RepID=D3BCE7_HETP5|nr:SCY1 family protein kinase [Heterostelium album PN500]EFA80937.1 SCY1 family protein kinase [Heterostelium album PN500]|eukprot:XP_020433055.1 SCY1 family protein kinase [Heterostelium album PN500]
MESVTQKFKGFLSSAISPAVKDFDLRASNAHTKFWKIHDATKKTSGEECSVFKQFEKVSKSQQEELFASLKKEAQSLIRLRHPAILNVVSAAEETKVSLYFATEPVLATLANLITQYRQRSKSSQVSSEEFKQHHFTFEELEIQLGISQVLEGVHFLNTTAKLLHRNISPESIFITKNVTIITSPKYFNTNILKWKIGGLGFSCSIDNKEPMAGISQDFREFLYEEPTAFLPEFDYLPPEYIQQHRFEYNSDLYSIGRVICELAMNLDQKVVSDQENISKLGASVGHATRLSNCRRAASTMQRESDSAKVSTILLGDSSIRGDLDSFIRSTYFTDIKVKSLVYLANISQKEDESKLQFFRGLFRIMNQFSDRIKISYVKLSNDRIVYVVLPNVIAVASAVKKELFHEQIAQPLIPILTSKDPKVDVLHCLLENVETFIEKATNEYIKKYLLPVVLGTLCGPTPEIIFQCLQVSTNLIKFFDPDTIIAGMIPRLTNLCVAGFPLHIRTKSIHWFSLLVPMLDKKLIVEHMIPSLEKILSIDNSPPILEALVITYEAVSKKLGGELLALKVLPALIPLSADRHLDLEQFKTIMKVVKDVLNTYEMERINELNNLKRFTKNTNEEMNQFNSVLGSGSGAANNHSSNPFEENHMATAQAAPPQDLPKISIPSNFLSGSSNSAFKQSPLSTAQQQTSPQFGQKISGSGSFFESPDFTSYSTGNTASTQPSSISLSSPPPTIATTPLYVEPGASLLSAIPATPIYTSASASSSSSISPSKSNNTINSNIGSSSNNNSSSPFNFNPTPNTNRSNQAPISSSNIAAPNYSYSSSTTTAPVLQPTTGSSTAKPNYNISIDNEPGLINPSVPTGANYNISFTDTLQPVSNSFSNPTPTPQPAPTPQPTYSYNSSFNSIPTPISTSQPFASSTITPSSSNNNNNNINFSNLNIRSQPSSNPSPLAPPPSNNFNYGSSGNSSSSSSTNNNIFGGLDSLQMNSNLMSQSQGVTNKRISGQYASNSQFLQQTGGNNSGVGFNMGSNTYNSNNNVTNLNGSVGFNMNNNNNSYNQMNSMNNMNNMNSMNNNMNSNNNFNNRNNNNNNSGGGSLI